MKPLVQGPRYLFHLLPLILILFSISYKNLSNLFINKYFSIIIAVASIFILYQGFDLFKKNFLYTIKYKNFKVRIKNDMAFPAYKYLNEIPKDLKKDLNLCATSWSVTPSGFKKKYIVSSFIINLESKIKSKECDLLLLDSWTVGRFTWYKGDIKNIISKKFDKLGPFERKDGRDIVYKNQKLTEYILQEEQSGFKVVFFNPRIVILKKNNLTNF